MAQLLVRGGEPVVLEKLKVRTRSNNRSLEAELRVIFQQAVASLDVHRPEVAKSQADIPAEVTRIRALFEGRRFDDSAELLRADRDERR